MLLLFLFLMLLFVSLVLSSRYACYNAGHCWSWSWYCLFAVVIVIVILLFVSLFASLCVLTFFVCLVSLFVEYMLVDTKVPQTDNVNCLVQSAVQRKWRWISIDSGAHTMACIRGIIYSEAMNVRTPEHSCLMTLTLTIPMTLRTMT